MRVKLTHHDSTQPLLRAPPADTRICNAALLSNQASSINAAFTQHCQALKVRILLVSNVVQR